MKSFHSLIATGLNIRSFTRVVFRAVLMGALTWHVPAEPSRAADHPAVDFYGDPMPAGAVARLGTIRFRHDGFRKDVAFAADNRTLISAAWNGEPSLKFWEARNGRLSGQVDFVDEYLEAMCAAPDRSTVATLSFHFVTPGKETVWRIKLWDAATRRLKSVMEWTHHGPAHFNRIVLTNGGKQAAKEAGRFLREEDLVPDLIVSSTAVRARKTAQKAAKQCDYPRAIELEEQLYLGNAQTHFTVVRKIPPSCERLLLVGHNPGISEFLNRLTLGDEEMPTAGLALVQLPIKHWKELTARTRGKLLKLWRPRESK